MTKGSKVIKGGVIVIYVFPVLSISHCFRLCILGTFDMFCPLLGLLVVFFSYATMSSLASFTMFSFFFSFFFFRSLSDELFWLLLEMDGELLGFFYVLYLS
jgi:hypothetical protein